MSTAPFAVTGALPPTVRRVRAYFAPVTRATGSATIFDPSSSAALPVGAPPSPWVDLGWIRGFARKSAATVQPVLTGATSGAQLQVREIAGAAVSFQFEQWTKLTMGLASGAQHMNVLAGAAGSSAVANGSGSKAASASALANVGSTPSFLEMSTADLSRFSAGSIVVVDSDYAGQIGFVGAGVSAAYVKSAANVGNDADYIRRVSFNVARVQAVTATGLQLATPLIAGAPAPAMKVQPVLAFVDREGGSFFQEWSALFVMTGEQGDQVLFHYPRLQAMSGAAEAAVTLVEPLAQVLLEAGFRALPVTDGNDGERVYCFRTYVPSGGAAV